MKLKASKKLLLLAGPKRPANLSIFLLLCVIFVRLGRCFQPTKSSHHFLLFSLKHAQNPLLVILEPSSLPNKILLFSCVFSFIYWFPAHIIWCPLINYIESSHVGPAPLPFRFCRRPLLPSSLSATVNVVVAATAALVVAATVGSSPLSSVSWLLPQVTKVMLENITTATSVSLIFSILYHIFVRFWYPKLIYYSTIPSQLHPPPSQISQNIDNEAIRRTTKPLFISPKPMDFIHLKLRHLLSLMWVFRRYPSCRHMIWFNVILVLGRGRSHPYWLICWGVVSAFAWMLWYK